MEPVPTEFLVKTTELPKARGHLYRWTHPFSNELHPPRQKRLLDPHDVASLGLSIPLV
jgi:hypothetical protein